MHSYVLLPPFYHDNEFIPSFFLRPRENNLIGSALKETSLAAMLEEDVIDRSVTVLFHQGLTQAEIAVCLAADNLERICMNP